MICPSSRWLKSLVLAAALALPCTLEAAGVSVHEASPEQLKAAQKTFLAADELFDAKRYQEAITAYRASWEIVASPNSRLQIARSYRQLGQLQKAYTEFEGVSQDAKEAASKDAKYGDTAAAAEREFQALKAKVARLRIRGVPDGAQVRIGDESYGSEQLPDAFVRTPGPVEVIVEHPDYEPQTKKASIAAGRLVTMRFELQGSQPATSESKEQPQTNPLKSSSEPAPTSGSGDLKPYAWIATGIGVAGGASFAVFGLMSNAKFKDLEDSCPKNQCPQGADGDVDKGQTYQTVANLSLVVGALGLATGITLFVLDSGGAKQEAKATPRLRLQAHGQGLLIDGRF